MIEQYAVWSVRHALYHSPRSWLAYWTLFWCCPMIWLACLFARDVPKTWLVLISLTGIELVLVPVDHYLIPIVPFLCLITGMGIKRMYAQSWKYFWPIIFGHVLLCLLMARVGMAIVRPWGFFDMRGYGMADDYEAKYLIEHAGVLPLPIWTNWPPLYFILDCPVPTHDFINADQMTEGTDINWTQEPYRSINTRIEMMTNAHDVTPMNGSWTLNEYMLDRGQFNKMRIWRRLP